MKGQSDESAVSEPRGRGGLRGCIAVKESSVCELQVLSESVWNANRQRLLNVLFGAQYNK